MPPYRPDSPPLSEDGDQIRIISDYTFEIIPNSEFRIPNSEWDALSGANGRAAFYAAVITKGRFILFLTVSVILLL